MQYCKELKHIFRFYGTLSFLMIACKSESCCLLFLTMSQFCVQNCRYWEAMKKFDEALQLTPGDVAIHEMRAQVLMLLREDFAAVQEAEQAVKLDPHWWVAHQTLGRARLQLGEIHMALRSFCSAVHLNPADEELRKDDLLYTLHLLRQKQVAEESAKDTSVCFDEDGNIVEVEDTSMTPELVCCRETR
ncbi:hypothetical protein V5799_028411 [Amblyomma americanum]|uniref:Tetratricopeptide repeat protein 33 n=1 Tax=Amblyomma americanum TaxID=6943 RepID=A0AAQ4DCY4_AMBAM